MDAQQPRLAFLPRVAATAALVVAAIGAFALLGWIIGVHLFAEILPDTPRMKANRLPPGKVIGGATGQNASSASLSPRVSQKLPSSRGKVGPPAGIRTMKCTFRGSGK